MKASDLRHGDVLLYEHRSHMSVFTLGIRIITGSKVVHCSVVQNTMVDYLIGLPCLVQLVLEQLHERAFLPLVYYQPNVGEIIHAVRPRASIPICNRLLFDRVGYGYWAIADSLINHFMGRITLGHWKRRVMLGWIKPENFTCSQLVGIALRMGDWRILEPDDFFNDRERFEYLGVVDFD